MGTQTIETKTSEAADAKKEMASVGLPRWMSPEMDDAEQTFIEYSFRTAVTRVLAGVDKEITVAVSGLDGKAEVLIVPEPKLRSGKIGTKDKEGFIVINPGDCQDNPKRAINKINYTPVLSGNVRQAMLEIWRDSKATIHMSGAVVSERVLGDILSAKGLTGEASRMAAKASVVAIIVEKQVPIKEGRKWASAVMKYIVGEVFQYQDRDGIKTGNERVVIGGTESVLGRKEGAAIKQSVPDPISDLNPK